MLNTISITSEFQLYEAIQQAGFTPGDMDKAASRVFWHSEWQPDPPPLSCYIVDFVNYDVYVVAINGHIVVYIEDQQDYWFHKLGELYGTVSVTALAQLIRLAGTP